MGNRYIGALPKSYLAAKIFPHHGGLFYQMDRGRASGQHYRGLDQVIHLEVFDMPIWSSQMIIIDNDTQFDNRRFKKFLAELHVEHRFTSVAHPQTNEEAEATNRTILHGLKTRLTHAKSS